MSSLERSSSVLFSFFFLFFLFFLLVVFFFFFFFSWGLRALDAMLLLLLDSLSLLSFCALRLLLALSFRVRPLQLLPLSCHLLNLRLFLLYMLQPLVCLLLPLLLLRQVIQQETHPTRWRQVLLKTAPRAQQRCFRICHINFHLAVAQSATGSLFEHLLLPLLLLPLLVPLLPTLLPYLPLLLFLSATTTTLLLLRLLLPLWGLLL